MINDYGLEISNIISSVKGTQKDMLERATRLAVLKFCDNHSDYDRYCLLKESFRYDAGNSPDVQMIMYVIKTTLAEEYKQ